MCNRNIQVLGPMLWKTMHMVADASPEFIDENTEKHYLEYIKSIQYIIPNGKCRDNYRNMIDRMVDNRRIRSRRDFITLINDMHNDVNKRLGKHVYDIDESEKSINGMWDTNYITIKFHTIILIIAFIIIIIILIKYYGIITINVLNKRVL